MSQVSAEQKIARLAAFGAPLVTVFVLTGNVSDPVNSPKFFLLGCLAFGLLAMSMADTSHSKSGLLPKVFKISLALFVVWSCVVSITSDSPLAQNLYGVYGRNTGLLTYLFLAIWALVMSRLQKYSSYKRIVTGFLIAGFVNVVYCAWVVVFGDFIGWNNPYKAILGTFGNPNFISSFLGMFLTVIVAFIFGPGRKQRFAYLILVPVIIWELLKADSLQGIVIAIVGIWLVTCYWMFGNLARKVFAYLYFSSGLVLGIVGLLGIVGFGPLVKLMAQPTVALREQYWLAAWKMGTSHPLFGVGMDSYGDWYRRMRGEGALIIPGPNVVTNVAHNVYLDIFAFGGFPLMASYISITLIGLLSIVKILRRREKFDPVFGSIAALWMTYHLQSIISINQIGLAIWGWITTGLLVAYSGLPGAESHAAVKGKRISGSDFFTPEIRGLVGLVIGALIAVPPLSADIKWMTALKAQNVESLEKSLSGDYLTPLSSMRLAQAAQTLERSGLNDLALKYARLGVEFNPNYDDAWETLYYIKNSTAAERIKAREQLIYLDPLNSEWKKLP
jgi:hypothetical protein